MRRTQRVGLGLILCALVGGAWRFTELWLPKTAAAQVSRGYSAGSGGSITLATVGSSPAAEGASVSGSTLTLQPADATHAGVMSTASQTFAAVAKNFGGNTSVPTDSNWCMNGSTCTKALAWTSSNQFELFGGNLNLTTGGSAVIAGTGGVKTSGGVLAGNNGTIDSKAIMQADSTTKGFLPPRMTTTQRDAITSPTEGLVIYNTTTHKLNVYTTAWEAVTSA